MSEETNAREAAWLVHKASQPWSWRSDEMVWDTKQNFLAGFVAGSEVPSHPDEETVTTVDELDALPLGSVLARDSTPTRAEVVVGQGDGWGTRFGVLNSTELLDAMGPLRVLFRPTPEGSETS